MNKITLLKLELVRIFGGWVETEEMSYGFYGIIPAWFKELKYGILKNIRICWYEIQIWWFKNSYKK